MIFLANSDTCLWTEWFDHDTPCNNDGDHEKHTDHYQRLDGTMTGPVRICKPDDIVETQYEGGSESYQVTAQVAAVGNALGSDGTVFQQEITVNRFWFCILPFLTLL